MSDEWVGGVLDGLNERADSQLGALVNLVDSQFPPEQGDILERANLSFETRFLDEHAAGISLTVKAVLTVSPADRATLDRDVIFAVVGELQTWNNAPDVFVDDDIVVRLYEAGSDWREQRRAARDDPERRAKNQQRNITMRFTEDGMRFESQGELNLYRVLKDVQASLPATSTIGIIAGPGMRTPERTFWPDIVVTYQGRAGVIEVDGPHHRGRAAADHSRDRIISDAGIRHLERIVVEDTGDPAILREWVEAFLDRLTRT